MFPYSKHITIRLLLLVLFIGYYGNITFFSHGHIINGVTIVHSHYFHNDHGEPSDKPQHNHNSNELTLIAHYASLQALINIQQNFKIAIRQIATNHSIKPIDKISEIATYSHYRRGPPSSVLYI